MGEPTDPHTAPIGHSISAHRVHGWCSHCSDHTPAHEVIAWRTREAERHAASEKAAAAARPGELQLTSEDGLPCPVCRSDALTVVTVRLHTDDRQEEAGGWALCSHCLATPYPRWEGPRG